MLSIGFHSLCDKSVFQVVNNALCRKDFWHKGLAKRFLYVFMDKGTDDVLIVVRNHYIGIQAFLSLGELSQ